MIFEATSVKHGLMLRMNAVTSNRIIVVIQIIADATSRLVDTIKVSVISVGILHR
jgi:hypothetical protein